MPPSRRRATGPPSQPSASAFWPRVTRVSVREKEDSPGLDLVFEGDDFFVTESTPSVSVNGEPATFVLTNDLTLVAPAPIGLSGEVRVMVNYGYYVAGECLIALRAGATVTRIRSDAPAR